MLLDEPAKSVMKGNHITLLEARPKSSPDLNPQELVWKDAESVLRKKT